MPTQEGSASWHSPDALGAVRVERARMAHVIALATPHLIVCKGFEFARPAVMIKYVVSEVI
jgi:hypothetical protein